MGFGLWKKLARAMMDDSKFLALAGASGRGGQPLLKALSVLLVGAPGYLGRVQGVGRGGGEEQGRPEG